jgi:hypothetical protein
MSLRLLGTIAIALTLAGCAARTERVYRYERDPSLSIKDADWSACDLKADREAFAEYYNARNKWALLGGALGGVVGGAIVGAATANQSKEEPEALRVQRDKTYEEQVRICLKKRGYPIDAPEEPKRGF